MTEPSLFKCLWKAFLDYTNLFNNVSFCMGTHLFQLEHFLFYYLQQFMFLLEHILFDLEQKICANIVGRYILDDSSLSYFATDNSLILKILQDSVQDLPFGQMIISRQMQGNSFASSFHTIIHIIACQIMKPQTTYIIEICWKFESVPRVKTVHSNNQVMTGILFLQTIRIMIRSCFCHLNKKSM